MKKYYHSAKQRSAYFEGWYMKLQAKDGKSLALIPAIHTDVSGQRSASLQVITDKETWWLEYPPTEFSASEKTFHVYMGQNVFHNKGMWLSTDTNGLALHGLIHYGSLTPLKSDIMGPFRFLSGMECSHGVISMEHALSGIITLNGDALDFSNGIGYIETDRGRSFPNAYLWTQCIWTEQHHNSLMLSIATIPLAMGSFTGCICAIFCRGQEYRIATYLGARIEQWSNSGAVIRQGKHRLEVDVLESHSYPLRAPVDGTMERTIRESLSAKLRYRFWVGNTLVFDHTDSHASFEYAVSSKL